MATIIQQLMEALDGQSLSTFIDPTEWEPPGTSGSSSENYGSVTNSRASSFLRLETNTDDATVRAAVDGSLSARPPGYDDVNNVRSLVNQFETSDFSEESTIEDILDDPLVGQPRPETVDLFLHAQANVPGPHEITGFAYKNIDVASIESTLSGTIDEPVLYGLNSANLEDEMSNLDSSDLVDLVIAGLIDVPIEGGASIAEPASVHDGQTTWAGFAVCTTHGPVDPLYVYSRDQPVFNLVSQLGYGNWPLFDENNKTEALKLTEDTVLPMAVLEELRRVHELGYFEWRAVGNNQKDLYKDRLRHRATRTPSEDLTSDEHVFEFDLLDWQNLFQLEAVTEFYANYHQPWSQSPIEQDSDCLGSSATISSTGASWKRTVTLDGNPDLSTVVPNKDVIQFDEDVERSEQSYLIVDVTDDDNEVEIHGTPDFDGSSDSEWRIPLQTTVNFLNPAGSSAEVTHGSNEVSLDVDTPTHHRANLRWLWLLHENLQDELEESSPDFAEVVPWMPATLTIDAVPDTAYRITDVDLDALTLTLAEDIELPSGAGSTTTGWEVHRRPRLVLIDPLAGRLSGRKATVHSQNTNQVKLEGPVPDLTRVNYNFDTLYLRDDTKGRAYRITKTPRTHDIPDDHVELHAEPDLENDQSTWSLGSGVGADRMPPLYYNIGKGQEEKYAEGEKTDVNEYGYDHHDGGLFVIHNGSVKNWFRWNSYTGRILWADKSGHRSYESSVRGNARYEYLSWFSSKDHLNHCFRVYDPLSRSYLPKRMYSEKIDTVREAGFYFSQEDGWETEFTDRSVQSVWDEVQADRADSTREAAGGGTDDGKTAIRIHWSPHYRPGENARSAGCITSPSFAGLRHSLCQMYVDEHELVFEADGEWDANRSVAEDLLGKEVYDTQSGSRAWRDRVGGYFWIVRPDQRPMEEL